MVLFPVAVTFLVTWWFIEFVDSFFSPIYARLGVEIFGKSLKHQLSVLPAPMSRLSWFQFCFLCVYFLFFWDPWGSQWILHLFSHWYYITSCVHIVVLCRPWVSNIYPLHILCWCICFLMAGCHCVLARGVVYKAVALYEAHIFSL